MGFKAKKLIGYIRSDRLNRLKSYIEKYGESIVRMPLDDKGRTALHLACRHSSVYCFAHLLKHKPNLMKTDADGNLPLHWALQSAKDGHHYAYTDIVLPLLKLCRDAQYVPNKNGKTGKQTLADLGLADEAKRPVQSRGSYDEREYGDSSDDEETDFVSVNNLWNERLQEELEYEYGETWGRYGEDYNNDWDEQSDPETYEDWTHRISSQYNNKHGKRPSVSQTYSKPEKRFSDETHSSNWNADAQHNFENQCRKEDHKRHEILAALALSRQKSEFIKKYTRLFDTHNPLTVIRLHDLPWMPCGTQTPEDVVAFLLADINPSDFTAKKKCLRELQVQWHPDKFLQKCGNRVAEADKEVIFAAVNHFSQIINAALDVTCMQNVEKN